MIRPAATTERVRKHTAERVNRRIDHETHSRILHYAHYPEQIHARLAALDREWDIERTLQANASALALVGLILGSLVSSRFRILTTVVAGSLLIHAIEGWCPPVPLFRRRGIRTADEIEQERYALKAVRGDFGNALGATPEKRAEAALDAVRG